MEKRSLLPIPLAPPDFHFQDIDFHLSYWWSFLLANTCSNLTIKTLEQYLLYPLKTYQKSSGFLTFSGGIEVDVLVFLFEFEQVYVHSVSKVSSPFHPELDFKNVQRCWNCVFKETFSPI